MKLDTITLTKKAASADLSNQQTRIIAQLSKGVNTFATLKQRCRSINVKRLRAQLRTLRAARIVNVTKA